MKIRSIIILGLAQTALAEHATINFFVQPYPTQELNKKKLVIDERVGPKYTLKKELYQPANVGVYATYNGYLTHSDSYGLVSFPRKTQREQFTILVTEAVRPSFFIANTIRFWHILDPKHAEMYYIERLQDPETELYYWKVMQTNLPEDYTVPIHTIVVLAKPKNIYVPLGITPTTKQTNLVLPPIYARKGLDHIANALFILKIKQFFGELQKMNKVDQLSSDNLITTKE